MNTDATNYERAFRHRDFVSPLELVPRPLDLTCKYNSYSMLLPEAGFRYTEIAAQR